MKSLICSSALLCSLIAFSFHQKTIAHASTQTSPLPQTDSTYWIFLTTGKSSQGTERSELQKMQAAHLANFGRLYKAGKLFAAGPLADPQKTRRGIVIAKATDTKSLFEMFESDPLIKNEFLKMDAIKMEITVGKFYEAADPNKLVEYRLVLLEKSNPDGSDIGPETQMKNQTYCETIHKADTLRFAGWLKEDSLSRRGILIFPKLDADKLKSIVEEIPAVKSKTWKATTIPLFMSDGVVK